MRADYDSQGDTLAIELEQVEGADYGDDETYAGAVVAIRDGRPVAIDVLGASSGIDEALEAVAERYELDAHELKAVAHSALTVSGPPSLRSAQERMGTEPVSVEEFDALTKEMSPPDGEG